MLRAVWSWIGIVGHSSFVKNSAIVSNIAPMVKCHSFVVDGWYCVLRRGLGIGSYAVISTQ
jgi:hypothetical protein